LRTIIALLTLAACGTEEPAQEGALPGDSVQDSEHPLDTNMTQGHTRGEHIEVAPGVFLLADLVESGLYRLSEEPMASMGTSYTGYTGYTTYTYPTGGYPSCFNYDYGTNGDEIDDSSLFGDWIAWNSWASAASYEIDGTVYHQLNTYAESITNLFPVDGIGATQYIFLNDLYIGFIEEHLADSDMAFPVLWLDVPCDEGYLDLSTFSTMYIRDGDSAIEVNNRADAYVVCCPQ
jgi:hypothetical protein